MFKFSKKKIKLSQMGTKWSKNHELVHVFLSLEFTSLGSFCIFKYCKILWNSAKLCTWLSKYPKNRYFCWNFENIAKLKYHLYFQNCNRSTICIKCQIFWVIFIFRSKFSKKISILFYKIAISNKNLLIFD